MDRRNFVLGFLTLAGAAAAATALAPKAEAAPLLDHLKGMDAGTVANPLTDAADVAAEGAEETQYYSRRRVYRRPRYRVYRRAPVRVIRRPRCVWVRNRFGRMVRRCY